MKRVFVLLVFLFQLTGFSQTIRLQLKEKVSGEYIPYCHSFIIDPVDNMVVGFAISSVDGNCTFNLIRPLRSEKFQLKLCDMHLVDSIVELDFGELWFYTVEWEVRKTMKWLTVYYNKAGIVDFDYEMDPYSDLVVYTNAYYDSLDQMNARELLKLEAAYQVEYNAFLKEVAWVDSASKANPELSYLVPPPPEKIDAPPVEIYVITSQQGEPPGGVNTYLNKIYGLKTLQPEWKKAKPFSFAFRLEGSEFLADTLIVFDDLNKVMKKSIRICKEMKGIMMTKWKPMKFNGRAIRLRKDVDYRINFIYREQ